MAFLRAFFLILDTVIIAAIPGVSLFTGASGVDVFDIVMWVSILFAPFGLINIFPCIFRSRSLRTVVLAGGSWLLIAVLVVFHTEAGIEIYRAVNGLFRPETDIPFIVLSLATCFISLWNGVIRVLMTSTMAGLVIKALGAALCMIPVVNIPFLVILVVYAEREVAYERRYEQREKAYAADKVCATKYPILFVHGVFFRDSSILNYWGRIPAALERCGAVIRYGKQQSALSVEKSAAELMKRIREVVNELGCEKVNVIAHSKGGLDTRSAITHFGADMYVASLTTVNTPHRGCIFVENIYNGLSEAARQNMAKMYNAAARKVGDTEPDFLSAVADLRESACEKFNEITPDSPEVYYRSVGSAAKYASSGRFPLNVSLPFVRKSDGENDGLVAVTSMEWGSDFRVMRVKGNRGVTHADMIDLNRENIPEFDVRSFYIELVSDLREKGF